MSRDLNGTTAYLTRTDRLGFNGYPLSVFVWFQADTFATTNKTLFCIAQDSGAANDMLKLAVLTGSVLEIINYDVTSGYVGVQTTATASTGVWQTAAGVWASSSSRSAYLNGANKVTSTGASNVVFADLTRTAVGANVLGPAFEFFDGRIAHCAVWSTALTDDDVAILHAGLHPTRVKSASLVAYWSVSGKDSPEIDIVGRNDLTVVNATVSNEEPRIARAASSYIVALGGANGTYIPPAPAPAPSPGTLAVMNTRFGGVSLTTLADFSPTSKEYRFDGVDSVTGQVFSTTLPQIWGSQWGTAHLQLINTNPVIGTPDSTWQTAFTADGFQVTRTTVYQGVPQAAYRLRPDASFANETMVYIRGKIKLPSAMATNQDGFFALAECKFNYTDQKVELALQRSDGVWYLIASVVRANGGGVTNLWGTGSTPNRTSTPTQDSFYASPSGDQSIFFKKGVFADDPAGGPPDLTRWATYEFAFRLQSPSAVVAGNAPSGWVWAATSVGTTTAPAINGVGTQRFYIRGSNMHAEPSPGATLVFPFNVYSNFPIQNLPVTYRQVEVYDQWPVDASVHPADAL